MATGASEPMISTGGHDDETKDMAPCANKEMGPCASTGDWYPGDRPENALGPAHIKLLKRIASAEQKDKLTFSQSEAPQLAELVRALYHSATTACVIADKFHGVAQTTGKELVAAHQRAEQLEAATLEFGVRRTRWMDEVMKKAVDVRSTLQYQDKQRRETDLAIARWARELETNRAEIAALTRQKDKFEVYTTNRAFLLYN